MFNLNDPSPVKHVLKFYKKCKILPTFEAVLLFLVFLLPPSATFASRAPSPLDFDFLEFFFTFFLGISGIIRKMVGAPWDGALAVLFNPPVGAF